MAAKDGRILRPTARRTVLTVLRHVNMAMRSIVGEWNVCGRIWDILPQAIEIAPGQFTRSNFRKREPHEYPENSLAQWRRLAADCRTVQGILADLEQYANEAAEIVEKAEKEWQAQS